eukprot:CAMPEP_0172500646 /NCGR_PEP_ID=MMETSP1066-20121228/141242_1 /TAXON_ID=671091 /ORGANISM="Coscinodiscus wailesii, Strain CCMP2513" /LENGTH=129 /DNA_ID=CAMNT_0013274985 /DNA_START=526 /DNA_END=918 /DNA_ORIENTATION=-
MSEHAIKIKPARATYSFQFTRVLLTSSASCASPVRRHGFSKDVTFSEDGSVNVLSYRATQSWFWGEKTAPAKRPLWRARVMTGVVSRWEESRKRLCDRDDEEGRVVAWNDEGRSADGNWRTVDGDIGTR